MQFSIHKANKKFMNSTYKNFYTVYSLAKRNRLVSDIGKLIELQINVRYGNGTPFLTDYHENCKEH